ncbi:winged helix-turn-helix domain-containing protein [Variovorax sp. J22P168]|uniref:ATP-binding protein n=1 Tax=Variovorax jilinensis TaxID=3053513 RepID=UPI0025782130|nr:winged helix-turn-helix domain-containing protein [Variovorax sp. J22P168]MDM0015313.1 winged helix-turn-helix domain-containing protein [Variovorax sp. J22P168]
MADDTDPQASRSFAFGPFTLVPERQLLLRGNGTVRIGGRALDILTALVEHPGELVSKRELMARVWPDVVVDEGSLKVNMAALRRVLGDGVGTSQFIATVVGRGYRFVASVLASGSDGPIPLASGAARPNHNLPTGTTRIFGRSAAIDAIRRELDDSRLVSIIGAGGIGKTTVALAVAEGALGSLKDGVWLVDLALLTEPALVANAIATTLGLAGYSASMLATLCEFLRDREMLLAIDNCEHVIEAASACANQILAHAPGVKILVTSREPLLVKGECVRRLSGLGTPPESAHLSAEEALTFPAVQLFVDRATERLESFKLCDSDAPLVAEICRRLDGLALAIEFAATRVDVFGVGGLLKQLDERFHNLVGRRAGPDRQRTLTATLDWSYGLLSEGEAALLRAMSVFAGVFDIAGASAVANASPNDAALRLAQLAAKSLLAMDLDADGIAYRLLETTRTHCLERLRVNAEEQAVRHRHAEYVCAVLDRASSEWAQRPAQEWGSTYARVLDDLRGALAWAVRDEANRSLLIRLTVAGTLLWNHFSLTAECRVHVSRAVEELEPAGLAGTALEMKLKLWLGGSTMLTHGLKPQALIAVRRALEIAVQLDDTDYRLRCLSMIGIYELFIGEHDTGLRTLENFASVAAAHDPSSLPESEVHSAIAELLLGRLQEARQRLEPLHQRDLRYFNGSYGVRYMFDTIVLLESALSHVQWLSGFPDTAARTVAAAVGRASPTHHLSLNNALSYSCPVLYWSGYYEECGRCVARLDEHVAKHGLVTRRPIASFYRAALACRQGDRSPGTVDALQGAIEEFRNINCLARMPYYLSVLADALVQGGRFGEAETTIRTALDIAYGQNEAWCLPELLRIQASVRLAQSQADEAEVLLGKSMAIAHEITALSWRLRAANALAKLWCARSRGSDAHTMLLPIFNRFTEGFATRDLVIAADILAGLSQERRVQ